MPGCAHAEQLAFDEAHKAKGAANDQPVGKAVVQLQAELQNARVVYLSATGATRDARAYAFDLVLREDVSPSATRWRRECAGGCHVLITLEKAHGGHFFDRLLADARAPAAAHLQSGGAHV